MDSQPVNYPESRLEPYYERQPGQSIEIWMIASKIHQTVTDIQDAVAQRDYMFSIGVNDTALMLDEHVDYLLTYLDKLRKGQLDEFEKN